MMTMRKLWNTLTNKLNKFGEWWKRNDMTMKALVTVICLSSLTIYYNTKVDSDRTRKEHRQRIETLEKKVENQQHEIDMLKKKEVEAYERHLRSEKRQFEMNKALAEAILKVHKNQ